MNKQMKTIVSIIGLSSVLLFAASSNAAAKSVLVDEQTAFEALDNSAETRLCVVAATSSQEHFKRTMFRHIHEERTFNRMYKMVANEVLCNGKAIADFAAEAGNMELAHKLASFEEQRVSISDLAKSVLAAKQDSEV